MYIYIYIYICVFGPLKALWDVTEATFPKHAAFRDGD